MADQPFPNSPPLPPDPEQGLTEQDILRKIAEGHLLEAFTNITVWKCAPGDQLIIRLGEKVPMKAKMNLMRNFDSVLRKQGMRGFFIPHDVEIVGVLTPRERDSDGTETTDADQDTPHLEGSLAAEAGDQRQGGAAGVCLPTAEPLHPPG